MEDCNMEFEKAHDVDLADMSFDKYQKLASRTVNTNLSTDSMIANFALGLVSEGGEVGDIVKKQLFHGHAEDKDSIRDELGDVLWYVANLARAYGISMEEVARRNVEKLKRRFPDGFSVDRSVNRIE
jgi:NTP pyrophosphatase (non-canonical NTP hydrolase)